MKLRSLRLQGFKSFSDATTLDFRDGVTAIVGSNGCGKSNIADSIRWVLGEQRASALRGEKMEEVIFQGTSRRRPLHYAEVALLFENHDGRVPIPQSEIEVGRKVFREGGSEYSLNRNGCRLRDIHDLFRDTGLGSNAHAVIEAGMVETLLGDRAEERRLLFEEAAGIGRYKDSRQAAIRRLESAETDVARLDDLIAEVEQKVRSLARQSRRAERYRDLRRRRLDLEVALARAELDELTGTERESQRRYEEVRVEAEAASAGRSATDLLVEERRSEAAVLARERISVAGELEALRRDLDAREREVLVADERRAHAETRIQQLSGETAELDRQRSMLDADAARLADELEGHAEALRAARALLDSRGEDNAALRALLAREREASDAAGSRARELAREMASIEGDSAAAERRRADARARIADLEPHCEELRAEIAALAEQTDLFALQLDEATERLAADTAAAEAAKTEIDACHERERAADEALRAAEDRLQRLSARVEAREVSERGYEGFAPAVTAIMEARDRFTGVHGPLVDFLGDVDAASLGIRAIEDGLGPLLQALVVEDLRAARELRRWFRDEWRGGGSLLLLPLDALSSEQRASPTDRPQAWTRALLADLRIEDDDPLASHAPGVIRVGPDGEVVNARGVIRLVDRNAGDGILGRREELASLRADRDAARQERDERESERDSARAALASAEALAREADAARQTSRAALERIETATQARRYRHGQLERDLDGLLQTLGTLNESAEQATARIDELKHRLAELLDAVQDAASTEADARQKLGVLDARWEHARDEEAELRVAVAHAENTVAETERRIASTDRERALVIERIGRAHEESSELRESIDHLLLVKGRAGDELDHLFASREQRETDLAGIDVRLGELDSELADLGEQARSARHTEASLAEERHRLELRLADTRSRIERVTERLEVEWGRPWESLVDESSPPGDGDAETWRTEARQIARQIESLGPVNMLAVEEHGEETRRLEFLTGQRDDLVRARDDLISAIRQINRTAREIFLATFDQVRDNFQRVFQSLFQGGECDLWLANADEPLESPIEIQASPGGKKTQRIHLLSGGERTLTALALLFALYLVKPSPFCVLDEVDAPLDESNVERFIQLLADFKEQTQFIVITHNPRTMEAADWVYGVTMEEPGVSSIVGVELLGAFGTEDRVA